MARRTPGEIAAALERRPSRYLARGMARMAERLVGREGTTCVPHALTWRLRNVIRAAPRQVQVHKPTTFKSDRTTLLLVSHDLSRSGGPQILSQIAELLLAKHMSVVVLSAMDGPYRDILVRLGAWVIICQPDARTSGDLLEMLAPVVDAAICNTVLTADSVEVLSRAIPVAWYLHEASEIGARLDTGSISAAVSGAARIWVVADAALQSLSAVRSDVFRLPLGLAPLGDHAEAPVADPGARLRLGVFGSIEPRKGQDLLLDAVKMLSPEIRAQVSVVIHGRRLVADFADHVTATARDVPEVCVGEALDKDAYGPAILACDGVIIPSRDEPFSIVAADALGARRVVLCSRHAGISQMLEDGVSGFVAPTVDPADLAAMITAAVERRASWPQIADAGRRVFDLGLSQETFEQNVIQEVQLMLDMRHAPVRLAS